MVNVQQYSKVKRFATCLIYDTICPRDIIHYLTDVTIPFDVFIPDYNPAN